MHDAVIVFAVTAAIATTVFVLAVIRGRKVDPTTTAEPVRAPLASRVQVKLLDTEADLVRALLGQRISPVHYRKRMHALADAARDWPRPFARS